MNLGKYLFWITWPLIWFYAPIVRRVRVYLQYGDEVLLVKNWFGPQKWQLPGGGIKFGESIIDAARRELKEELGFILPENAAIPREEVIIVKQFGLIMRYHVVTCRLTEKPTITPNHEITALLWASSDFTTVAPEVVTARKLL